MGDGTIFDGIIKGEVDADVLFEDDSVMAFRDINPQAPVHFLVIPKERIASVNDLKTEHEELLGRMFTVARNVAEQEEIAQDGYRLVMNCGDDGGQDVYHIHLHVLGGRSMEWPPG